jgi:predicted DCC family thiol-disulfide oxidoreductase YuxK
MMEHLHSGEAHLVVLYDGVCALCNRIVRFLLKHDRNDIFRFAPLQSRLAEEVLARHRLRSTAPDTVCLIEHYGQAHERLLTKSDAALYAARELGGIWRAASLFRILPRPVRDFFYDLIARSRYRVFGKYDTCPLPDAKDRPKFLATD